MKSLQRLFLLFCLLSGSLCVYVSGGRGRAWLFELIGEYDELVAAALCISSIAFGIGYAVLLKKLDHTLNQKEDSYGEILDYDKTTKI